MRSSRRNPEMSSGTSAWISMSRLLTASSRTISQGFGAMVRAMHTR